MPLRTALFDIETDGLNPTRVWYINIQEAESDFCAEASTPEEIARCVRMLEEAHTCVAHNGIRFDFPVLERLHSFRPKGKLRDSYVMAQVFLGDVKESYDYEALALSQKRKLKGIDDPYEFKGKYLGSHSLAAWGHRVGLPKGDYAELMKSKGLDPWAAFSSEMREYGRNDVAVLKALWNTRIVPAMKATSPEHLETIISIEHFMERQMLRNEQDGILLDVPRARALVAELLARQKTLKVEIEAALGVEPRPYRWRVMQDPRNAEKNYNARQNTFRTNIMWHPRRDAGLAVTGQHRELWAVSKRPAGWGGKNAEAKLTAALADGRAQYVSGNGYGPIVVEGEYTPIHWTPVSASSRKQVALRMVSLGWEPLLLTPTGDPTLSEVELLKAAGEFPVAAILSTYFTVDKKLGMLLNGKNAWLKLVDAGGFIHPRTRPCAAITARATHSSPNISQVPSVKMVEMAGGKTIGWGEAGHWGADCRALFIVPPGFKQVGVDLAGIELRCLAHYLHQYDEGAFLRRLMEEDVHEENRKALGLTNRTDAKRFIFAWMYGAGDEKLGSIIFPTRTETQQKAAGRMFRERLTASIKGTASLLNALRVAVRRSGGARKSLFLEGTIDGLDGRNMPVRGMHSLLNTLLQSAGTGILPKYWIYLIVKELETRGWKRGYDGDFAFLLWSHDELQFAVREGKEGELAELCVSLAAKAGEMLSMRVPVSAEAKIGVNWFQTH